MWKIQNLINVFYWTSLFCGGKSFMIINLIILAVLLNLLLYNNTDKWIIKQKIFAFITLTISNILFYNFNFFKTFSNTKYIYFISFFITFIIFAMLYYIILMFIYLISEIKIKPVIKYNNKE
ncbi:putative membrane protein [Rickettsia hoogstraalii str. RCCE3]|nr:putative membrane protein [Rickettsia hoogstraalii str. RCCE3]